MKAGLSLAFDPGPRDFRLVGAAAGTWLSALASLRMSAPIALLLAGAAAIVAGGLWRWVGRAPLAGLAAAVLLGTVCGATATAARLTTRDSDEVAGAAHRLAPVTVELTIRRDPRQLGRDAGRPPSWLVSAWLHRVSEGGVSESGGMAGGGVSQGGGVSVRARILVLTGEPGWHTLVPGQRVQASGRLTPARGGDLTAAVLSTDEPPTRLGNPPWFYRAAGSVRAGLREASAPLPDEPGGLVPGLAVGDVSNLDPGLADDFFATGMSHLVAVSGTHTAIVVGFVFLLARAARAPPWLVAGVSGLAIAGYVLLCQASPSVLRAGLMGTIALVALASGRLRVALPALAATVILLVVIDPQLAGTIAFTLSVLATAGLLLLAPRWRDGLRRAGVPRGLAEALAVPAAAQVAVSPVIAGFSGTVSLVAVAANLIATPVMPPATILGVLAAVVWPVWAPAGEFLAWLASWPAWWLVLVARYGAQVPAAVVPWPGGVAGAGLLTVLTVAFLVAARHRLVRRLAAVLVLATVVGAAPVRTVASGWPPDGAVVITCAVGQGDLVVLPVRAGEAVVVDAGPEPAAADRCLRDLRIGAIPLLLVSHFHADHVAGVEAVFRRRAVGAVLTPGFREPEPGYASVARAAGSAGAPIRVARPGEIYQVGEVTLEVFGPPYPLLGTRSDANNNSLVIMAEVRGVRVLLTGDAEVELQQYLLDATGPGQLRADVLKLPHHGSAFQEPSFLEEVAPAVAMVPVGPDNSYGHPHPALLAALGRDGVRVLRTDTEGDVAAVRPDGGELSVVTRPVPVGPHR